MTTASTQPQPDPLRLNIGGGGKHIEGWVGVDRVGRFGAVDVDADIRDLPYEDGAAEEVMAIHVIEHLYVWEALPALAEWVRVLRPGGQIAVECPDLDKVVKRYYREDDKLEVTQLRLYGDPGHNDPLMCHRWCYTAPQLARLMREVGLIDIREEPVRYHRPHLDMRLTALKAS